MKMNDKVQDAEGGVRFSFSAVSNHYQSDVKRRKWTEEEERAREWVVGYWITDHNRMKDAWEAERKQWKEKRDSWAAMWAKERNGHRKELASLTEAFEVERQRSNALLEDNYHLRAQRTDRTNKDSERHPETRLSLVLGDPVELSPTSPTLPGWVTCNGGPGWVAPRTLELVVPKGMAITSPTSPDRPLRSLNMTSPDKEAASQGKVEQDPWQDVQEGARSSVEERIALQHVEQGLRVQKSCHCCGNGSGTCRCQSQDEAGPETAWNELEKVKAQKNALVKKLARLEDRIMFDHALIAARDDDRLAKAQQLISTAADTVEKIQIELLARQIEMVSIKKALGMKTDDITISLSDISTRMMREPLYPTEEQEQRERLRGELVEELCTATGADVDEERQRAQLELTGFFFSGGRLAWRQRGDGTYRYEGQGRGARHM
ncbi:hypothetical protein B0J12DRAFT_353939 [Macrophomina phaseolina]|uniref:SH3 domain-containing protein n=1 Tax=Macrophomina phaseolina TaxID=35725 RepID=A0ABQ8FUY7_9PEZI|nr:hypothetical protein B0J12DRAFT_353939 [Macrophomina phaseolina]